MRIQRDIIVSMLAGAVAFAITYLATYADRDGLTERTGYPPEMLTAQAVECGLFVALVGFIVVLSIDAFWLSGSNAGNTR